MSGQDSGFQSPGLESTGPVDSTSAPQFTAGNTNPFWSARMQEEYRLRAARPDFLGDETTEVRATERVDADALKVPVREDASVDDEHPPYDMEQIPLGENPGRHTAGGDMLRRTMNAAARESDVESATVRGTQVANCGLVPSTRANVSPSGAAQGSPDRYPGTVFQQLL